MYEVFERLLQMNNVTTYQVAKATGISQSTFSNWKTRRNLISPENGKKIAEYFDISLDYLMGNSFIEDMGHIIQEERTDQGISQAELAEKSGISVFELDRYESQGDPIREDILDFISFILGTTYLELQDKYGLYDAYIPSQFNDDVIQYENYRKAQDKEAMLEYSPDLIAKDSSERRLLMLCRKAGDVPEDEKEAIINQFESTIDIYLKAKGLKKE